MSGEPSERLGAGFLLGQLTAQIVGLNQRLDQLMPMVARLDATCDDMVRRVGMVESEISYMKPHVSSWSRCKNRIAGIAIALPFAGGAAGLALDRLGAFVLKIIGDN